MKKVYPRGERHNRLEIAPFKLEANPRGLFYRRDVLEGLNHLMDKYQGKIQLVYIDPPFMTGQLFQYRQKVEIGNSQQILEHMAYNDQWKEGKAAFLSFMEGVLRKIHSLLAIEGCLYLHVDYRTSAYLRIMLDEIFGEENFLNEIIWHYQSGGRAKRHFSRKHDTILFYRKSSQYYFNIEATGVPRGKEKRNNMKKEIDENGKVFWSIKSGGKVYRYYEDSKVYPSDVWTDISHLHQRDPERTGYDTQKPEALLERIISASSRPGDYVADFFAGSGTTLVVAQRLGRKWIGIDSSPFSLHVCRKRLTSFSNKDFIMDYDINREEDGGSEITIRVEGCLNDGAQVTLLDYKSPGTNIHQYQTQDIDVKGLAQVDYWAIGYLQDNLFYPRAQSMKGNNTLEFNDVLQINRNIPRNLVVQTIDIFGGQSFFELL